MGLSRDFFTFSIFLSESIFIQKTPQVITILRYVVSSLGEPAFLLILISDRFDEKICR